MDLDDLQEHKILIVIGIMAFIIILIICILGFLSLGGFFKQNPTPIPTHHQVTPTPTSQILNGSLYNDTFPLNMTPGYAFTVTIKANNLGNTPWSSDNIVKLAVLDNATNDAALFGNLNYSIVPNATIVPPGGEYTWQFTITAPKQVGNYTLMYQMMNDSSSGFGNIIIKNITVGKPGNDVLFSSIDIPSTMNVNSKVNVTVLVLNMGRTPWYEEDSVLLGIRYEPNDGTIFTQTIQLHMNPDSGVMPGETCKWRYPITAPSYVTQYNVTYQMMKGDIYFGEPITRTVKITN